MGKKDKKKKDPSVQQKKKMKQQEKAKKKAAKGEGSTELAEEDIEAILAEFRAKEATKTAVTVQICPQPSPRANFSLTTLPSGEMLLFGGEYYDGDVTVCYNGVFRWNLEKNEWRAVESINTPPPRCSHQAVCFRDHLYVFGGEFSTSDQFYHYRDFWRLDLKTNQWEELPSQKDSPSARSGHRMVVHRNYLLLFGGFYEAFRETRWFNDLYVYSFQDMKWRKADFPSHALVPAPRSGCQMVVSSVGDCAFVYGGYSRVKAQQQQAGGKGGGGGGGAEGKVHEDLWVLQLKNMANGGQPYWERASRKGSPPSLRSGASMVGYRTIALLFGGVHDVEGKRHDMTSHFYADLYQLDLVRKKWFEVRLRSNAGKKAGGRRKTKAGAAGDDDTGDGDPASDDEDEEGEGKEGGGGVEDETDGAFAFIDQDGNVVYLKQDDDDEEEGGEQQPQEEAEAKAPSSSSEGGVEDKGRPVKHEHEDKAGGGGGGVEAVEQGGAARVGMADNKAGAPATAAAAAGSVLARPAIRLVEEVGGLALVDEAGRPGPIPRINAAMTMRGHMLYVYGGVFEDGDREVTCDDAWCLDLNRRQAWQCVLPGTMHEQVWRGEESETEDDGSGSDEDDDDEDEDDEDEGSGEEEEGSDDEEEEEGDEDEEEDEDEERKKKDKKKKEKKKEKKEKEGSSSARDSSGRRLKKGGESSSVRSEMEELKARLSVDDPERTPQLGEKLRDFFARTTEYWTRQAVQEVEQQHTEAAATTGALLSDEAGMREKEYRRLAFQLAGVRFEEVRPVLERLDELEQEQREAEERMSSSSRGAGGRKGGAGGRKGGGSRR